MITRWGIIGCGDVTEVKSGPGFQLAPNSRLVAVMRRNGALAEDYARRHSVAFWSDNADEIIHHPEVDVVYIATPPGSHLDYALRVCAAKKPAYVEKPMARNHAECLQMVEAFQNADLPLFVAYYRRGLPRFLKVKEMVERGEIGTVTGVRYRFASPSHRNLKSDNLPWRWVAAESGGGQFLDLGCHTLDILDFMVGQLHDVKGDAANIATDCDVEDLVAMQFRLESGAVGVASWNFAADSREDLIEIMGTDGTIRLTTFGNEPIAVQKGDETLLLDIPNPRHIQQPFIETMLAQLHGTGTCHSTGVSAARTSRVMDTVLSDYYSGRDDAFWLRPETWQKRR